MMENALGSTREPKANQPMDLIRVLQEVQPAELPPCPAAAQAPPVPTEVRLCSGPMGCCGML